MQCKCGSQDGEYRQGVSKKNNKPWRGWKCSQCGEMQFLRSETPKTASTAPVNNQVSELLKRNNELLVKILSALTKTASVEPEELTPDEETPF